MENRLETYRNKCKIMKKIQSNKASKYRRINNIINFLTVFVSAFITFIGFSGADKISEYINLLWSNNNINTEFIQMIYNLSVFILFVLIIFHMVFQFGPKQIESEKAIAMLSDLKNEIDDLANSNVSNYDNQIILEKYALIVKVVPANTDNEYKKAKRSLEKRSQGSKEENKIIYPVLSAKEQEKFIVKLIEGNKSLRRILELLANQSSELYLGGGVIRNLVWDKLHNYNEPTPIDDIDIIYYDPSRTNRDEDINIEKRLRSEMPNICWSVKNQARMHSINDDQPYSSLEDAVSKWPETVSAILLRKDDDGRYIFIAPFGFDDLFRLIVQPTPRFMSKIDKYQERIKSKNWADKWDKLKIFYMDELSKDRTETQVTD